MVKYLFTQRVLMIALLFLSQLDPALAKYSDIISDPDSTMTDSRELNVGYYVVVGSFNIYENVQRFTKTLVAKGYTCDFAFSDKHNRYYTYIYYSDSLHIIKQKVVEIRNIKGFEEAWVLLVGRHAEERRLDEIANHTKDSLQVMTASLVPKIDTHKKDYSKSHFEYSIIVNTLNASRKEISSKVKVVTIDKGHLIKVLESQKNETVLVPKDQPQKIELICESFGYRQSFLQIDLSNPLSDTTTSMRLENNHLIVDLILQPNQKGDVMVMYNVFFFPNTNILRQKSTMELQRLVDMLKNNEKYKVMVHGHTNGNSNGEITTLPENCKDFFNPSETILTSGNSHKLSELRAETIRLFLIQNGIDPSRLSIKGWGGKKMLYGEKSPKYEYNVRVEVEILEDK